MEDLQLNRTKTCFDCKRMLPLDKFTDNKRGYVLKTDYGKNRVCKLCTFERAIKSKSLIVYNFEIKKFDNIKFNNLSEVAEYFETHKLI